MGVTSVRVYTAEANTPREATLCTTTIGCTMHALENSAYQLLGICIRRMVLDFILTKSFGQAAHGA